MDAVKHRSIERLSLALPAIPKAASSLRVSIVSDAIDGRNGVGTYYPDLVQHLSPYVQAMQLIAPAVNPDRQLERFALPMPGDRTQRMAWPIRKQLFAKLDELDPNVIVIPSLGAYSYFAMRYAQRRGVPFAIVNHTNFDHLLSLYWPSWMVHPLRLALRRLNQWLCRQASAVAAMSADAFEEATEAGSDFVRVMGTPLSFDFLNQPLTPLSSTLERTVFVGRLAEEKGIRQVLRAACEMPNVSFVIAGDGPLRGLVKRAAATQPNIEYLGWVGRDRVLAEMDKSQLLLLPSIFETFGTVALEALARRRMVLASRHCGITKWPSLASSILYIGSGETVGQALQRVIDMSHQRRVALVESSWKAVRIFHDHTVRTWLKFLCDASHLDALQECLLERTRRRVRNSNREIR